MVIYIHSTGLRKLEIRWKKLLINSVIWITAEIVLNCIGLDTLADYSEFVLEKNVVKLKFHSSLIIS